MKEHRVRRAETEKKRAKSCALELQGKAEGALVAPEARLAEALGSEAMLLPQRRTDVDAAPFSTVLTQRPLCHPNAPLEFQQHTMPARNAHPDDRAVRAARPLSDLPTVGSVDILYVSETVPSSHAFRAFNG